MKCLKIGLYSAIIASFFLAFCAGYAYHGFQDTEKTLEELRKPTTPFSDSSIFKKTLKKNEKKDTVIIGKGGSLCRDLGMTEDEALLFAKRYSFKNYYHKGFSIVLVHPGDIFIRDWRPARFN